jgi:hypothetical protein
MQKLEVHVMLHQRGKAFGARLMSLLTDPSEEPDQAKWETEVAIRLAS